jgi:hypothetical protein
VLDGIKGPPYESVGGLAFDTASRLHAIALKEEEILRLEIDI